VRGLDYSKPLSKMRDYLAAMDAAPFRGRAPAEPPARVLAALGPKMLELSAEAADGAHPYFTTPDHTAMARQVIGPDKLLLVEQKVILSTDAGAAREAAKGAIGIYAELPNYRNNWKRIGFTEDEISHRDDRFVDGVIAWGDEKALADRVKHHYDAGADHVCIQPLSVKGPRDLDWGVLEALAPGA